MARKRVLQARMPEETIFDIDMEKEESLRTEEEARFFAEYRTKRHRTVIVTLVMLVLLVVVALASFYLGKFPVAPRTVVDIIIGKIFGLTATWTPLEETVVMLIRMPRILGAIAVGGALAVAGATYQSLFKNPMVSPDILGAASGAGVGACLMMLLGQGPAMVTIAAFAFGLLAVGLSYALGKALTKNGDMTLMLVLCGMTVNALASAVVSLIKYFADTESQLPEITYWLMGSVGKVTYTDLAFFGLVFLIGFIPILCVRWQLNVMAFGDDEAKALGINVGAVRAICVVCATLITAAVVSIAGTIGWVGLMIPHLVRFFTGPDNKRVIPLSLLAGSIFMVLVDDICRAATAIEVPLGVVTSFVGAPFFIFILFQRRKGMN